MTKLRVDVVTLFPGMFTGWLESGGVGRAIERNLLEVALVDLRAFGLGKHLQVDDYPFGGGPGMVLMPEPVFAAVDSIARAREAPIILLSARGRSLSHRIAEELALLSRLTLIAGHYEGVDERVAEHLATDEISIGDYVLSGGELPAMVLVDAVARFLPGAIGDESRLEESFVSRLLEYPQYTRPATYRGWQVPPVLTSGDHAKIASWRMAEAKKRTVIFRPDLIEASGKKDQ